MCVIATCCDRDQYNLLNFICTLERAEVRRAPSSPAAWRLFSVCACVHVIGLSGKERKCLAHKCTGPGLEATKAEC